MSGGECLSFGDLDSAAVGCLANPECAAITAIPGKAGLKYELRKSRKLGKSESGEISFLKGPCSLQCIPLQTAISTSVRKLRLSGSHFDFLSLDVEGAELEVLKTVRFEDTNFSVITVEANPNTPVENARVRSFLAARDYVYYGGDGFNNDWFHHAEFKLLRPRRSLPAVKDTADALDLMTKYETKVLLLYRRAQDQHHERICSRSPIFLALDREEHSLS